MRKNNYNLRITNIQFKCVLQRRRVKRKNGDWLYVSYLCFD
jgi:hypothetical protein